MNEEVVIDIKIDAEKAVGRLVEVNERINELKERNKELANAFKESGDATGRLTEELVKNEKELGLLKGEQKSLVGVLQQETKANASLGDSYNELNARLSQLQKEYKSLTAEQRNSEGGKAMLAEIAKQKQALKDIDATMGDYQRNVGNYAGSLAPLFGGLSSKLSALGVDFSKGFAGVQQGLATTGRSVVAFGKTLLATPIGWFLTALAGLVAIFSKVADAIKKNDDASTALSRAFASLQPVINIINKAFNSLANAVGWLAGKFADFVAMISDTAKEQQELITSTDKLEERERAYARSKAKNEAEIARLREQAIDKEEYSAEQRRQFLKEAQELEKANLDEAIAIQKERIRLREADANNAQDTSDATKNEIADMYAELDRLNRDYETSKRTYTKQLNTLNKEELADEKEKTEELKRQNDERINNLRESQKEEERLRGERLKTQNEISKALEDAVIANMEEGAEKEIAEANLKYEREVEALRQKYADENLLTEQAKADLNALLEQKEVEKNARLNEIEEEQNALRLARQQAIADEIAQEDEERRRREEEEQNASNERARKLAERRKANYEGFSQFLSSVGQLSDQFSDKSKALAIASKGIALGQIAVSTGKAVAEGVAQAQSVPFPGNLSAIATTVATILSNIATATSTVKSAKFAGGGIVEGTSYYGDKVVAWVNSGEMVLNKQQQSQLFDIANGRNYNGIDYEALAIAVGKLPSPTLDYEEFTNFEKRTTRYNEIATL